MEQINFIECTIKEYCPIIAFTRPPPSRIKDWEQKTMSGATKRKSNNELHEANEQKNYFIKYQESKK